MELDKKDLVSLVVGTEPTYSQMSHPLIDKCGKYWGGFDDKWIWTKSLLERLTEEQLVEIYKICKDK